MQRLTGLSKGNLSSHLARLEGAELVTIEKEFVGKIPNTRVSITKAGRSAVEQHWERLDQLRQASLEWSPDTAWGGAASYRASMGRRRRARRAST